jgi:hypothetical protein
MLSVYDFKSVDKTQLSRFFARCRTLGYVNNESLESIRTEFVFGHEGNFWFLVKGKEIIGMAGCHRFDELHLDQTAFRIQFRGCELPGSDVKPGLSRSHFNSSTFRELIPYQLKWVEDQGYNKQNVFLTANVDNRNHRAMQLIEQQGFLTKYYSGIISTVEQTVWKFNTEHYEAVRKKVTSYVV